MSENAWLYFSVSFYALGVIHGSCGYGNIGIKKSAIYGIMAIAWPLTILVGVLKLARKKGGAE